jgi:hypothetical protein
MAVAAGVVTFRPWTSVGRAVHEGPLRTEGIWRQCGGVDAVQPRGGTSADGGLRGNDEAQGVSPQDGSVWHPDVDVETGNQLTNLTSSEEPAEFAADLVRAERDAGEVVGGVVLEHPSRMTYFGLSVL